jgi:hypothetical protein
MSPISKKIVNLKAEFSCDSFCCDGFIDNISEHNICCTTTAKNLPLDTELQVKFQPDSGEALNLNCKLKWAYDTPPYGITNSVGMEILNQSTQYKSFLESLP